MRVPPSSVRPQLREPSPRGRRAPPPWRPRLALGLLAIALAMTAALGGCKRTTPASTTPLRVAAAADLAVAFGELGRSFEQATGQHVDFAFGSSGLLARQLEEGAPFDVFAAANESFVDDVVKSGACVAGTKALYARGRLVVWTRDVGAAPKDLAALAEPRFRRIALANPEHAPYGRAAKEALVRAGVWDAVASRVVYGENVQQALVFAQSGNADAALVALSLASSTPGGALPVDAALHAPLDQAIVVCRGDHEAKRREAAAFVAHVGSPAGRAVMRRHGFLLPGERAAD